MGKLSLETQTHPFPSPLFPSERQFAIQCGWEKAAQPLFPPRRLFLFLTGWYVAFSPPGPVPFRRVGHSARSVFSAYVKLLMKGVRS